MTLPANAFRQPAILRWLLAGLTLLFLAVYTGPGGYIDQYEYMEMAEQLWLHGSFAIPDPSTVPVSVPSHATAAIAAPATVAPTRYHRYPIGLMLVSAPFVWLGEAVQAATGGTIVGRAILCLAIPFFALVACALVFRIATDPRCGIQVRPAVGLAAALIFGLGTPLFNYQRLYYAEVPVALFLITALYAHLRGHQEPTARRWPLITGTALAAAVLGHYADAPLAAVLGLTLLLDLPSAPAGNRLRRAALVCFGPILTAVLVGALNTLRFGTPFDFGYARYVAPGSVGFIHISTNLKHILFALARTAWLLPALLLPLLLLRRSSTAGTSFQAFLSGRLALGLAAGASLQLAFWSAFSFFGMYPLRYSLPLIAAAAPGLIVFLARLDLQWPRRGLVAAVAVLLTWSAAWFLYFDCNFLPPLIQDGDCGLRAFYLDQADGGIRFYTWYRQAGGNAGLMYIGTPPGALQWAVLAVLLIGGGAAIGRAVVLTRRQPVPPTSGTENSAVGK